MGIGQRKPLRKFEENIRRWVAAGKSDDWIASALGTSASSVQSFRSRHGIYRRHGREEGAAIPHGGPLYEGVLEKGERTGIWFDPSLTDEPLWNFWKGATSVRLLVDRDRIVIVQNRV